MTPYNTHYRDFTFQYCYFQASNDVPNLTLLTRDNRDNCRQFFKDFQPRPVDYTVLLDAMCVQDSFYNRLLKLIRVLPTDQVNCKITKYCIKILNVRYAETRDGRVDVTVVEKLPVTERINFLKTAYYLTENPSKRGSAMRLPDLTSTVSLEPIISSVDALRDVFFLFDSISSPNMSLQNILNPFPAEDRVSVLRQLVDYLRCCKDQQQLHDFLDFSLEVRMFLSMALSRVGEVAREQLYDKIVKIGYNFNRILSKDFIFVVHKLSFIPAEEMDSFLTVLEPFSTMRECRGDMGAVAAMLSLLTVKQREEIRQKYTKHIVFSLNDFMCSCIIKVRNSHANRANKRLKSCP